MWGTVISEAVNLADQPVSFAARVTGIGLRHFALQDCGR